MTFLTSLLQKSWLESRTRFLTGAALLAGLCFVLLIFQDMFRAQRGLSGAAATYAGYIYLRVYGGFVRGAFLLLALTLGLGGLNSERARRTAAFTLALPVTRFQLVALRALTGLMQIVFLALIPAILVPTLSAAAGQSYPWSQSFEFFVLWVAIGSSVFAASFLASCFFANDYSALTASILAFAVYPLIVARTPALRNYPLHIHYIMNGTRMPYFDPHTYQLIGPIPWTILAGVAIVTLCLLAASVKLIDRTDFS